MAAERRSRWLASALACLLAALPAGARAATPAPTGPAKSAVSKPIPLAPAAPVSAPIAPVSLVVRAGVHDGFGRLVFAAPGHAAAVPVSAEIDGTRLTLRFARPVAFTATALAGHLDGYLSAARLSDDGLTLTGRLARSVTLRTRQEDRQTLIVDLLAVSPAAQTATAAQTPALPAQHQKAIPASLHIGTHKGVTRLVLDPAKPLKATLARGQNTATLTFDAPARLDTARAMRVLPEAMRPLTLAADGRSLSFGLPPGWRAALTRSGRKLVVDAIPGPPPAPPPPPEAPPAKPIIVRNAAASGPPPGPIPKAVPTTAMPATPLAPPEAVPSAATTAAITAGLMAESAEDNKAGIDMGTTPTETNIGGSFGSASGLRLIWSLAGDGLTLRFEWPEPVAAAVFRRAGTVWIVFDQEASLDLSRFQAQNLPVITAIDQIPVSDASAFRLGVWAGFNPLVARAGNTWIVSLKNGPTQPEAPVQPHLEDANDGTSLLFPVLDPAQPVTLPDSDTQESLIVVPLPLLGQGVETQLSIPDLRVLSSVQGLVIKPVSDALSVRADPQDVSVTAPGGLLVSTEVDRTAVRQSAIAKREALIDFPAWQGKIASGDDFFRMRQALEKAILDADQPSKSAARANLAKFYIANSLGAEALGVLAAIERDDPEAFDDPRLRAIRAVASEEMDRPTNALADLQDKVFDTAPDAILWRAAAAADQQNWDTAVDGYSHAADRLRDYPAPIRRRLDLKFAEALLDARPPDNDPNLDKKLAANRAAAKLLIADVTNNDPTQAESDATKVMTGRILGVEGDVAKAQALWQEVSASPLSSLARAEAGYALVLSNLATGKISRLDAIEALDRMRFDWRGDDFEVRLLRKMGELRYDDNDYHGALDAFRQILTNFPTSPYIPEIAGEMQRDFTSVFVGPRADTVPPVAALAVFQEFKVLTPPGKLGDAVARNLIDRLTSIDLLDRAAGALYQEVTTRLTGLEQARGATELALLELLQGKPDEARRALALPVDDASLTPALRQRRQEFAASAAFMAGDRQGALALLQGDSSADADRLRADVYWANHDWKSVASLLTGRLPRPGPDVVLDGQSAAMVINAATAMSLANDQPGLAALRSNYAAAMASTSLKDDFATLVGSGVPDPATLANFGSQVAGSRSFIETYRQRLTAGRLSEVVGS